MLEIRITPVKMFKVLSTCLEEAQAKSIILDLLLEMEGQTLLLEPEESEADSAEELMVEESSDNANRVEVARQPQDAPARPRVRKSSRRVNFSLFGGESQGLDHDTPDADGDVDDGV